ncbi:hypothetical protein [Quadrisphaera sp. INWT6]|uniref:hypothetical protein n=1 Tax=Quadrisphaera sp. INWT6 TaxID=2596917 RepID=UPI0018922BC7|nr:hypothetical protein [Quadrisphaera sp. INWT6]MBF5082350.1 hypothetical protein [Quadrisphaera sp. INWT6]
MSTTPDPTPNEPAAALGVARSPKDPEELSARLAEEAVRQVHAHDDVAADSLLQPHPDPKVPGANYVEVIAAPEDADGPHHIDDSSAARYWVGLAGEVVPTETTDPHPGPNPDLRQARTQYTAAVEAVRLRHKIPVSTELFATPDTYVPGAFFVHERDPQPLVRWVDAGGQAYDGYQLLDGAAHWDEATVAARRQALASQPSTADLVDPGH